MFLSSKSLPQCLQVLCIYEIVKIIVFHGDFVQKIQFETKVIILGENTFHILGMKNLQSLVLIYYYHILHRF